MTQWTTALLSRRVKPFVAWRAIRRLLADPDDTTQVFSIIEALKGDSLSKATQRLRASESGRRRPLSLARRRWVALLRLSPFSASIILNTCVVSSGSANNLRIARQATKGFTRRLSKAVVHCVITTPMAGGMAGCRTDGCLSHQFAALKQCRTKTVSH